MAPFQSIDERTRQAEACRLSLGNHPARRGRHPKQEPVQHGVRTHFFSISDASYVLRGTRRAAPATKRPHSGPLCLVIFNHGLPGIGQICATSAAGSGLHRATCLLLIPLRVVPTSGTPGRSVLPCESLRPSVTDGAKLSRTARTRQGRFRRRFNNRTHRVGLPASGAEHSRLLFSNLAHVTRPSAWE